ncbi:hypothetical protein [Congregibacter litoralis]|uniref:DUF2834 domain-containing protein n=1 Tax=Congregibacter litoralis KT71 TaxID=314285 RepID=A4A983_9GAMM|nr:hypothetical protein [Congregibacter litoralis]EAQ97625.2 hypothetical protein KT71_04930 [Congregibacter litoralis KT71]
MNRRIFSLIILVPFAILTGWSLMNGGISGILATHKTPGGLQVFVDLVIALILLLSFLVPHARARGRNPWIWVALTLVLGSFGPLLYLATVKSPKEPRCIDPHSASASLK